MKSFLKSVGLIFFFAFFFSGCSLGGSQSSGKVGGVLKSTDSGSNWELKNKVSEKVTLDKVDVFSMVIDPVDTTRIYLGTRDKGVVFSKDEAESWEKMKFPGNKVYGIAINHFKPGNIYATGVKNNRGKVYRTDNYGEDWREIYTEPASGTVVTSLALDKSNAGTVYLGTSGGVVIKTVDGGVSWRNLYTAADAVTKILFGGGTDNHIYFMINKKSVAVSDIDGSNFRLIGAKLSDENSKMGDIYSIAVSENDLGSLYIGTDSGLFRSFDAGENLEEVQIIASSKEFPIRSIAVNPRNSQELIYSAAQAIYKSTNGGKNWSTYQLDTGSLISQILFDPDEVNTVYAGLRDFN